MSDVCVIDEARHRARRETLLSRLPANVKIKPYMEFYYGNLFEKYQWLVAPPYKILPTAKDRTGTVSLIALFSLMDSLVVLDNVRVIVYLDVFANPNSVRKYLQSPIIVISTQHLLTKRNSRAPV